MLTKIFETIATINSATIQEWWNIYYWELGKVMMSAASAAWLLTPYLYFSIARKFDALFKHRFEYPKYFNPRFRIMYPVFRAWAYAHCIAFLPYFRTRTNNGKRLLFNYPDFMQEYDFRKNSTSIQKSICMVCAAVTILFAGTIFAVTIGWCIKTLWLWVLRTDFNNLSSIFFAN